MPDATNTTGNLVLGSQVWMWAGMTGEGRSQDDRDYNAMQAALSETERGRWFLSEHERRHRGLDTQVLLEAIGRIESALAGRPVVGGAPERSGEDLPGIALMVTRIADALTDSGKGAPPESLPRLSDIATSEVLDATERIQEAAWTLRERGTDPSICDLLDQRATEIYAACAVQDGLARRVAAAIELVRSLDERLGREQTTAARKVATASLPAPARSAPARGSWLDAPAVTRARIVPEPSDEAAAWPLTAPTHDDDAQDTPDSSPVTRPPPVEARLATLDAVDALDIREKLRLFT